MFGKGFGIFAVVLSTASGAFAESVEYGFDDYTTGPIDGQHGWNVYNKVPDSSAISVIDAVGRTDAPGDKALVVKNGEEAIRVVSADPVRWMPGDGLHVEFDFKLGIDEKTSIQNKPVMTFFLGDSLLSEKGRWEIRLETTTDGSWNVVGGLPDWSNVGFPPNTFVARPKDTDVAISDWFHMVVEIDKRKEPDSFWAHLEILDAKGDSIIQMKFTDREKDDRASGMWETSRLHVGFNSSFDQHGLVCIDNIKISTTR